MDREYLLRSESSSVSSSSEFSMPPYEVVPATRPIIVLGPSLRGYEVTDLMHKALYNYLKKRFHGRIHIFKAHTDIGQSKRSTKSNASEKERFGLTKSASRGVTAEIQREIEQIYELSKSLNIVIIDSEVINHPSQLTDCSLAPVIVYIKMLPDILQKLIKLRGRSKKNMNVQVVGAQKLLQCHEEMFDLSLDEAIFEDACAHLGEFLDQYWRDLHPDDPEIAKQMMLTGADFPDRPNPMLSSASGRSTSFKEASERKQSLAPLKLDHITPRLSVSSAEGAPGFKQGLGQGQGQQKIKKDGEPKHKASQIKHKVSESGRHNAPGFSVTQYEEYPADTKGYEEEPQNGYDYYYREQGYEQGFDYAAENPYGSPMAIQEYGSGNNYGQEPNQYDQYQEGPYQEGSYQQGHYQEGHYQEGQGDYGQYGADQVGYQLDYGQEQYGDSQNYMQDSQYGYQGDQMRYDNTSHLHSGHPSQQVHGYGPYDDRYPNEGGYY
ncbi:voltage-dependent L-type calcium channel subunit beta-2-like isoform X2 [Actinia tenebrosa]|uniref:Voltage-dependent L-type calcium channel subunit beta-2-like isoform X2 n=1 Tax=Actinia tenebrosa TaxID=6105 RepID=A0A6P8IM81_ACTTE|nr:voltage-dependent L-type calcium channel subunit beta-2-like isoform X2 [Actinia tenebrosa]